MTEDDIKTLKQKMASVFDSPDGRDVMEYLESACGWYESIFDPINKDRTLINAGRREVIATIKTFLNQPPEVIAHLAQQKENDNV